MNSTKIIVALDFADAASALMLVKRLDPALCRLKVGKELFTAAGPEFEAALDALVGMETYRFQLWQVDTRPRWEDEIDED